MTRYIKTLFLLSVVSLTGCFVMNRINADGLKRYFLSFIDPVQVQMEEVAYGMFESSRQGYYIFNISAGEFAKLNRILSLKEVTAKKEKSSYMYRFSKKFESINEFTISQDVKTYRAEPPLTPLEGNTASSFHFIFFNAIDTRACAILEYPYG